MLSDVIVEEKDENEKILLRFETAVQRYLSQFISTIFNLHAEVMERCSPGTAFMFHTELCEMHS